MSTGSAAGGGFQEFHVRRVLVDGELRVANPGVAVKERRRIRDMDDLFAREVLRVGV